RFPKKRLGLLSDEGLKSAITSPAKRLGVTLEKGLLERILRDLNRDPGILPLLEFAMTLLWERQTQRKLTHAGYDAIGGVEKALAHYADNVYRRFQERGDTLRRIFVQLVRPGEGTEDIRQVATRERMGTDNWPLVEELADGRLLVTGYSEALKTETVELAHESLIRHWRPLQEWIKAERGFRVWQNRLRQALSEWQEQQKEDDLLLCGAPLAEAEEWLEQYGDALTADEREFIEAGIRLREHEIARGKRLRWGATLGLLAITVMALAFAAFAYFSSEQQKGLRQAAEEQRDEALRKQSVLSAKLSKERIEAGSKEYGMLWALEELPSDFVTSEWPYAREAESPSYRAILAPDAPKNITELERGAERHFAFSPDGSRLVVMSLRGDRSPLLDVKTGKEIATLPSGDYADFSPDGAHVVTTSMSKIQLWNAETGEQISEIKDHEGVARIIQFIADGRQIFTASALEDGARMQIWDSQTGERVEDLKVLDEDEVFRNAAMSPDGGRLAVRVEDKKTGIDKIYLYDVASRKKLLLVNDGRGALWPWAYKKANLGFSPDR
ncbi:MAG: WD40 repeat domain-containing protein, partial [Pseudomonadota bacterium]